MNQETVGMYAQRGIIRLKKEYVRTAFKTAFKGVFKKVVCFLEIGSMLVFIPKIARSIMDSCLFVNKLALLEFG